MRAQWAQYARKSVDTSPGQAATSYHGPDPPSAWPSNPGVMAGHTPPPGAISHFLKFFISLSALTSWLFNQTSFFWKLSGYKLINGFASFILWKWLALEKLSSNPFHQKQWLTKKYHLPLRFPKISIIALLRTLIYDMIWVIKKYKCSHLFDFFAACQEGGGPEGRGWRHRAPSRLAHHSARSPYISSPSPSLLSRRKELK